ncbi:MAG: Fis family transcriptional regulator, partial [Gammaproteobacteria bacterium]|nr:Fis family transcriptional regulator [Gammaproteobacteria bacterium]
LRERPGDVPVLIKHFCTRMERRGYESSQIECNADAMAMMLNYPWPGNVRELENAVEHGIICSRGDSVGPESLPQHIQEFAQHCKTTGTVDSVDLVNERIQRSQIESALRETNGNKAKAAEILGVDRSTLWRRMQRHGI